MPKIIRLGILQQLAANPLNYIETTRRIIEASKATKATDSARRQVIGKNKFIGSRGVPAAQPPQKIRSLFPFGID